MNRLEGEWHQLLTHEIAGRLFEDEYDLATAILNGMEARSVPGCYTLKRFKFNSASLLSGYSSGGSYGSGESDVKLLGFFLAVGGGWWLRNLLFKSDDE